MPHQVRLTIHPDVSGGFRPKTFEHLLQQRIHVGGLDRQYIHTLVGYNVAVDGDAAELIIHSEPVQATSLTHGLIIDNGVPTARVRAVTREGDILTEVHLAAPLRNGQQVRVNNDLYAVDKVDWPGRDKVTRVCSGDIDWQVATLVQIESPNSTPVRAF